MKRLALFLVSIALVSGCAHKQSFKDAVGWNEKAGESVELSVQKIKVKGTKADVLFTVRNKYDFTIVIPENSLRFALDRMEGLGGRTNPRLILKAGDATSANVNFKFPAGTDASIGTLTLQHVYQGEDSTSLTTEGTSSSTGIAVGVRHLALGRSDRKSTSITYEAKTSTEGSRLPDASVQFPIK